MISIKPINNLSLKLPLKLPKFNMCNNCPICFEQLNQDSDYLRLKCKHEFHFKCIFNLMTTNSDYNSKCPMCRDSFIEKDVQINIISTQIQEYQQITKEYKYLIYSLIHEKNDIQWKFNLVVICLLSLLACIIFSFSFIMISDPMFRNFVFNSISHIGSTIMSYYNPAYFIFYVLATLLVGALISVF